MHIVAHNHQPRTPDFAGAPQSGTLTPPARRPVKVDPLAEHRRRLAQMAPSPEILILLRATGYRGEVYSALHALELFAFIARGGRP